MHKIKCKDCDCFLEYDSVKDNLIKCKSLYCTKNYASKFDEYLKQRFRNTFKFSNNDINKFTLLLEKMFILMNTCMSGKSLMKHHFLENKNF